MIDEFGTVAGMATAQGSPTTRSRWVTGLGAGLSVAGVGLALIAPADFLGVLVLVGAALLAVGIAKRI